MSPTGTYNPRDLINDSRPAAEVGYRNVLAMVTAELNAYNALMDQSLAVLASQTTERIEGAATGSSPRMVPVDEYGRPRTQKGGAVGERGFPIEKKVFAAGFTNEFLEEATVGQILKATQDAEVAHTFSVRHDLMVGFLTPNNRNYTEYIVVPEGRQALTVNVKALYNGDTENPVTANGQRINGPHNHYLAVNGLTESAAEELANTVAEHSTGNQLVILINQGDAASWRALAGFVPATPVSILNPLTQAITSINLDTTRTDDRTIGVLADGTEVRTKPWVPKNYAICVNLNGPRPLKQRVHPRANKRGLRLEGTNAALPLQADYWRAYHGFGASARGAAAVLYTGGAVYTAPNFADWTDEEGSDE